MTDAALPLEDDAERFLMGAFSVSELRALKSDRVPESVKERASELLEIFDGGLDAFVRSVASRSVSGTEPDRPAKEARAVSKRRVPRVRENTASDVQPVRDVLGEQP
jgi:hypothetical protein